MVKLQTALSIIETHYGQWRAKRSKVLLINHIHEGVSILQALGASEDVQAAFCIHPLVQNSVSTKYPKDFTHIVHMAEMYTIYANTSLCTSEFDKITANLESKLDKLPVMPTEIAYMLYADKIQNYKDFKLYHYGTHENFNRLNRYFRLWINYLIKRYDFTVKINTG
jgi:hypothetical protein